MNIQKGPIEEQAIFKKFSVINFDANRVVIVYILYKKVENIFALINLLLEFYKLEFTEHITPHANGEPLLKRSFSHSHSSPVLQ